MICHVCPGGGWLITFERGIEYWRCPCCGGQGVSVSGLAPPMIGPGTRKKSPTTTAPGEG